MGCSSEMMSITARISALIRATYEENLPDSLLHRRADQLERYLFEIQQHCPHLPATMGERISATTENNSLRDMIAAFLHHPTIRARAKILALTAEARRQAALVLLHLCVRKVPVWRGEVQSRVSNCLVCVGAVAQLMAAADAPVWGMTPLVWPLFIAGAAAVREEDRFQIADAFAKLRVSKCLGVRVSPPPGYLHDLAVDSCMRRTWSVRRAWSSRFGNSMICLYRMGTGWSSGGFM